MVSDYVQPVAWVVPRELAECMKDGEMLLFKPYPMVRSFPGWFASREPEKIQAPSGVMVTLADPAA
jgi:hypothetical protein